jgi:2-dehydro-3-deoxyphosphogluconate aldolase/(4S)-4-hydroxy-2-oxoglutarate aldolase
MKASPKATLETLIRDGFLLVYNSETLDIVETARALQAAGINNMEVTCRIRDAVERLRRLKCKVPEFKAGAASLMDFPRARERFNARATDPAKALPSIEEMVNAGADYLVSAIVFRSETYAAYAGRLPMIPGCATPSEVLAQYELGANFCKLFPASLVGGVKWLDAVDPAIHRFIPIMPTGGTTCENIPDYVKAGTLIFGGSFSMIPKDTLKKIEAEQDYGLLAEEFVKIKAVIDTARSQKYPGLDFKTATLGQIEAATGRDFNVPEAARS